MRHDLRCVAWRAGPGSSVLRIAASDILDE
jgi:hypothetical protein